MRAGGRLLAGVAALSLLTVLAVWLVPPRLDWNRFRPEIERLGSAQLGRAVSIAGPITLTLLPEPVMTASAVTVDGTAPIRADALRLRVGLGALLAGHVEAKELVLRGVDMRIPWPLPASSYPMRAPNWLAAVSARIERGRISVGAVTLDDIDATLTTGTLSGSYAAVGTGRLDGRTWRFTARLSEPGGDGSAALDATLDGTGPVQGLGATLSGQLGAEGTFGGRMAARGPDLSRLLPAPAVGFSAEGRVTVADGLAAADDLAVNIGGSPAQAAVALRLAPAPRLDVALAASRIDLDAWLPSLASAHASALPLGIDVSAEAAQLGGGTLRRLRSAIDLSGNDLVVREFTAILPGDARIALTGRTARANGAMPGLDGDFTLAAPRLRATLAWLEPAFRANSPNDPALPPEVLREADLKAHVFVSAERLSLTALSGTLDLSPVRGEGAITFARRPSIRARLSFDDLKLDPWLREGGFDPGEIDIDGVIEARSATWRGRALAPLRVDAAITPGRITLRSLQLTTGGVRASLAGTLVAGGRIADGAFDVAADDLGQLASLFPEALAPLAANAPLLLRLKLHARTDFAGPATALGANLAVELGDLRVTAAPVIDVPGLGWSGALTMRHPGAPRLAELFGLSGAPAWLGDGSFALVAQLAGAPGRWTASSFDVAAGSLRAAGQLTLDTSGQAPRLDGRLRAETLPLPLPYGRSPEPFPIPALAGWRVNLGIAARAVLVGAWPALEQVSANLVVQDGAARLEKLTARLGGGQLAGEASIDLSREPPRVAATMDLSGATVGGPLLGLPLDLSAGTLNGHASLAATGSSPAGMLATLSGALRLDGRAGTVVGLDLARATGDLPDSAVRASLAGGSTAFDRLALDATVDRGQVTLGRTVVDTPAGQIIVAGAIDLPNASAALHVTATPAVPNPPEIGLTLTGPLRAPERTPELAGAARWRVARTASAPVPKP